MVTTQAPETRTSSRPRWTKLAPAALPGALSVFYLLLLGVTLRWPLRPSSSSFSLGAVVLQRDFALRAVASLLLTCLTFIVAWRAGSRVAWTVGVATFILSILLF